MAFVSRNNNISSMGDGAELGLQAYSITDKIDAVIHLLEFEYNFTIVNLPVPQLLEDKPDLIIICVIYMLLCLVGLIGNTGIASIVIHILKTLAPVSTCRQTCIYILGLCLADSLLLFSIPLFVLQVLLNNWLFGKSLCRIYLALETVTKLLSTFILTALSLDRYMAIKSPGNGFGPSLGYSRHKAVVSIIISFVLSTILLLPLPINATVKPDYRLLSAIGPKTAVVFVAKQCIVNMSDTMHKLFNAYTFILGFCLPGCIISQCYIRVFRLAKSHSLKLGRVSQIPLRRVFRYTVMVVCFYFICNSPFWLLNISFMFYDSTKFITQHPQMKIVNYVIHILPFINSAFNWVFYALLNSQLRELASVIPKGSIRSRLNRSSARISRDAAPLPSGASKNDYDKFCLSAASNRESQQENGGGSLLRVINGVGISPRRSKTEEIIISISPPCSPSLDKRRKKYSVKQWFRESGKRRNLNLSSKTSV